MYRGPINPFITGFLAHLEGELAFFVQLFKRSSIPFHVASSIVPSVFFARCMFHFVFLGKFALHYRLSELTMMDRTFAYLVVMFIGEDMNI